MMPDNRAMAVRVGSTVLVVSAMLIAATVVALFLSREPQNLDVFMGCLGQTGPETFSLAVSRVLPNDPLRIETYGLVGTGGLRLSDHVGHTIEVTGALEEAGDAFPRLHASSARHVATSCWRP